jgi:hypothetical protein
MTDPAPHFRFGNVFRSSLDLLSPFSREKGNNIYRTVKEFQLFEGETNML